MLNIEKEKQNKNKFAKIYKYCQICLFGFSFVFVLDFFFNFSIFKPKKKVLNIEKEKQNKQTNKFAKIYKYFMKKNIYIFAIFFPKDLANNKM